jgi:hypothetical protein
MIWGTPILGHLHQYIYIYDIRTYIYLHICICLYCIDNPALLQDDGSDAATTVGTCVQESGKAFLLGAHQNAVIFRQMHAIFSATRIIGLIVWVKFTMTSLE